MHTLQITVFSFRTVGIVIKGYAIGAGGRGFDFRVCQFEHRVSPMTRHPSNVFSDVCCPRARLQRFAPPLVTRFGVIPRV